MNWKKLFAPHIEESMSFYAGGRKDYQHWVSLLRRMKKIEGGSQMVDEIVAGWKVRYKNRPAMMDELSRL